MKFISIGKGIPRDESIGKVGYFGEIWEIYYGNPYKPILWDYDKGVFRIN